jgi:hypothetical protein
MFYRFQLKIKMIRKILFSWKFLWKWRRKENLILEKNQENENLLSLALSCQTKLNLKFLFEKILEIFGVIEMRKLLRESKGF